jgi:hypothetical protein
VLQVEPDDVVALLGHDLHVREGDVSADHTEQELVLVEQLSESVVQ